MTKRSLLIFISFLIATLFVGGVFLSRVVDAAPKEHPHFVTLDRMEEYVGGILSSMGEEIDDLTLRVEDLERGLEGALVRIGVLEEDVEALEERVVMLEEPSEPEDNNFEVFYKAYVSRVGVNRYSIRLDVSAKWHHYDLSSTELEKRGWMHFPDGDKMFVADTHTGINVSGGATPGSEVPVDLTVHWQGITEEVQFVVEIPY